MFDPQMALLSKYLEQLAGRLDDPATASGAWEEAARVIVASRADEPELAAAVDDKDAGKLRGLVSQWSGGQRPLPVQDREVLKRAMTAFRKSLKVTRLHDESSLTRNPMTIGRRSAILGITPPPRYPLEVWHELVRQKRLIADRHGLYELPPE